MPTVVISDKRCKGCERCLDACPQKILGISSTLNQKGFYFAELADPPRCIGCRLCAISCPDSAIDVFVAGTHYEFFSY